MFGFVNRPEVRWFENRRIWSLSGAKLRDVEKSDTLF